MSDAFLDAAELKALTGYTARGKQAAWLASRHWPHEISATGRVLVLRDYMVARMSGIDRPRATVHATRAHKFEGIR